MRLLCLLSCSLLASGLVSPTPKCGMLVVGLAGNNGVTLLAGQIANRKRLTWESSRDGPRAANCLGCITQVGALADQYTFVPFSELVVGGWDVVPTKLGDALYRSRVLCSSKLASDARRNAEPSWSPALPNDGLMSAMR